MGERITFPSNGHTCSGYPATPEGGGGLALFLASLRPEVKACVGNDTRPEVHDAEAAQRSWERTVQFLHGHLD